MFSFKQFTIHQDRTAMKVCTDACVLGAYADVGIGGTILDIGTGTGLLALMAAQRNPTGQVDAVEVDDNAFQQAVDNVTASPFAARIRVVQQRIQEFAGEQVYDRILTNPPFYTNHLRSPDAAINRALHTDELPFDELVESVVRLLKPDGEWWVLLPPYEMSRLVELAGQVGLKPFRHLSLQHHVQKPVFRLVTGFAYSQAEILPEMLFIYEQNDRASSNTNYTSEFRALLQDFYLAF